MFVQKVFAFSFGGRNNYAKEQLVGSKIELDFYNKPAGIGFAIRDGKEAKLNGVKDVCIMINCSSAYEVVIEFKTLKSGNSPEKSFKIMLDKGSNAIMFSVPNLDSKLNEIVMFFPNDRNTESCQMEIKEIEL